MYFIKNSFYTFYSIHNELIDIFIRIEGFVEQTEKILFFCIELIDYSYNMTHIIFELNQKLR